MPKLRKSFVIENIPQPKKELPKPRRLGLINKSTNKHRNFRLRHETQEQLGELAQKAMKKLKLKKPNMTQVIELLIDYAHTNPSVFNDVLKM